MAKKDSDVLEMDRSVDSAAITSPKLVVTVGRGGTGKTTLIRYLAEETIRAGRPCVIADGDRTNATLLAFFKGVNGSASDRPEDHGISRPPSPDSVDVAEWLTGLLEQMIVNRHSVYLDLGGGDQVLKEYARELELVSFCEANGIEPVAIHLIGPSIDDLSYLDSVERTGVFAPKRTILALNLGKVPPGMSPERAFDAVKGHDIFLRALDRGAKAVLLPRLGCMNEVDSRRLLFSDAKASRVRPGQLPLGPVRCQLITNWMRDMQAAFSPLVEFLP